ncbi:Rpn family recombination-promoting nuclease/putative transposase [Turicibacter sanguinis]|uniref:Rpn family recombination-promoting nuclease/putative transposase n=1 Tax=Turicibacter sanguinis TaxID=154288 RepID=UPI00232AC2C4|nr:Rpn family recombination-promoting nuclease/putative transposase [Turicibacter sanguinis]MDB8576113.1 Rpn family recombination-promoting nuclease/putative transposase [Turicibacter sanguinis]MDB8578918.1 Rpn family recombination-promoting nuclease/putative transposase [Turicibacter sanguinis]MDB8584731.1 Rpn family recombination-promoting nuclease/putative transposase [Turicibacter sanguinis]MDB8587678.1 Rpn family recombination-promoting nuclease/putative transposase [Turicibacter sanguinis
MTVALLPPKMDFVFKRIFGNENHPNVLISFLNAVLNPVDPIKSVSLKDTTIEKSHLEDKYSRLDVKAITNKGEHINIEIQLKDEYNMIKRSLYYWSKLYEGQLENGENYQKLSRTICINLLDFNLLNHDKFHSVYRLKDCETNEELTDVMELHFIELKKIKDVQRVEEVKTKLEAWLYFINQPESELVQELEKVEVEIKEAKAELVRLSGDRKERERYEKRRESRLNEVSALSYAEEKGIQKGIEEGVKQGLEQGAKQRNIEIAKNLIQNGLDNELISKSTGLSIEEVKEIRKEQN